MKDLTTAERRGALVLVVILALGAARDLWWASRPREPQAAAGHAIEVRPPGLPEARADSAAPRPRGGTASPVDLNRATIQDLDALPGIGPVLAGRILAYRASYGPFGSVDELRAVRGIGPRLLERLRPQLTAGSAPPGAGRR
ncbi:MAG TPA: helix-hairpin-helix domain-containing protein [Candidatus Eisenbacteria bacterium]|jgi:competence ComEA-like helix-hairpin-helix protein